MATSPAMSTSNQYIKYTISITQNSQNVTNNSSNVSISVRFYRTNTGYSSFGSGTVSCKIDGITYTANVTPDQKITENGIVLFSKTLDISHNSDGSKTLTSSAWINLNIPLTSNEQSYSQVLTTIPRASSFTGGSGNIGSQTNITISRATTNFVHKLYYDIGDGWNIFAANVGTSYTWIIPTSFYEKIPNSNSGSGNLFCETYNDSAYIGVSSRSFTFYVTNSNPIFNSSQLTYQDINQDIVAITGDNQSIVRNKSNLSVTWTAGLAVNSATIASYKLTFNGTNYYYTSPQTVNFGLVNLSSNANISIQAIDSRGNSTTISKTITIFDWHLPTATISLARVNNFESTTNLKVSAVISSVNDKNSIKSIKYRTKKTSDTNWSDYTEIQNNTDYTETFDNTISWNFEFIITDQFDSVTFTQTLAKGLPIMFFDTQKISVGVNTFPQNENSFETANLYVSGKTIFDLIYPIGSIYISVNAIDPGTLFGGTWVSWGQGKTIIGVNPSDSDFQNSENTGGEKSVTLSESQIPSHYGHVPNASNSWGDAGENTYYISSMAQYGSNRPYVQRSGNEYCIRSNYVGGGNSHNNLPPYITCYMWKRTD